MDALTVLIYWLHVLALALWIGGLAVLLLVLPSGRRVRADDAGLLEAAQHRIHSVVWWSVIALLVTLAAQIVLRAVPRVGVHDDFMQSLRYVLFASRFGIASIVSWVALVVALLVVDELGRSSSTVPARTVRRGPQALGIVARGPSLPRLALGQSVLLRAAAALAVAVVAGTAAAGRFGSAFIPALVDALHVGAAGVWLGGTVVVGLAVAPLVALVQRQSQPLALLAVLDRFSPLAVGGMGLLALTGAWEAAQRFRGLSTPFGRALAARDLVLLAIVGVSAWGTIVTRPRLRRLALRARRDYGARERVDHALTMLLRLLWTTPPLAALALLLGSIAVAAPDHLPRPARSAPIATGRAAPRSTANRWQAIGPAAIVHSLVVDPANHTRLLEGTTVGVYLSADGGRRWSQASAGLSDGATEVWSLTFIPDGSVIAATGMGLYRSTDGAARWRPAGLPGRSIYTIAVHRAARIVLLAGGDGGIFRSDDVSETWHQIYDSGEDAVTSLAWPAVRPKIVVAGINPGPASIAISRDGGITWQVSTRGLPTEPGMMSVAVAPGARDVYAGTMGVGTYISRALTGQWHGRNAGLPGLNTGDAHIGGFAFDPYSARVIYAATDFGVYRSHDGGLHWSPFGTGLGGNATIVTSLTLVTGARPELYATTAAGLYRIPLQK